MTPPLSPRTPRTAQATRREGLEHLARSLAKPAELGNEVLRRLDAISHKLELLDSVTLQLERLNASSGKSTPGSVPDRAVELNTSTDRPSGASLVAPSKASGGAEPSDVEAPDVERSVATPRVVWDY